MSWPENQLPSELRDAPAQALEVGLAAYTSFEGIDACFVQNLMQLLTRRSCLK